MLTVAPLLAIDASEVEPTKVPVAIADGGDRCVHRDHVDLCARRDQQRAEVATSLLPAQQGRGLARRPSRSRSATRST